MDNIGYFTLGVDFEDFLQCRNTKLEDKVVSPSYRIEEQTDILLSLLEANNIRATFFVLGMLASYRPDLIKRINEAGHEIGIHGFTHKPLTTLSDEMIEQELYETQSTLSNLTSSPVVGFRAPCFSITNKNIHVLQILTKLGFEYDSSIVPANMLRYGIENFSTQDEVYLLQNESSIVEFPITIYKSSMFNFPIAGGGYMRLLPKFLISYFFNKIASQNKNVNLYCHPYEFDKKAVCLKDFFVLPGNGNSSFYECLFSFIRFNLFRGSITNKFKLLFSKYNFVTFKERANYVKERNKPAVLECA